MNTPSHQTILSYPRYGQTVKVQDISGFVVWESTYPPCFTIPHHTHTEGGYFDFVLKGGYTERSPKGDREFSPSIVIFRPPGTSHADQFCNSETRLLSIRFPTSWLHCLQERAVILNAPAQLRGGLLTQLASRVYREFREADAVSSLVIEGLVLEMLAEGSRESGRRSQLSPPRWLAQAQELLHERFSENLPLSVIAAAVGVHSVHLNRVFRQHFRCTVGEYMRRLRVEFACQRLSSSDDSLAEIGIAAGFSDQSHFCRVFQKFKGMTPLQYRSALNPRSSRSKAFLLFNT